MLAVLIAMATGMLAGYLCRRQSGILAAVEPATAWVIRLLLFLLGYGIGADHELVSRIPELGGRGLVLAAAGILGSIIAARLLVGKPGNFLHNESDSTATAGGTDVEGTHGDSLSSSPGFRLSELSGSLLAALAFFLGVPAGLYLPIISGLPFDPATPVLYLLMFLVGMAAGSDSTALVMIRRHGFRLLLLPVAVVVGTFAGTLAVSLLWPSMPIRESLAVGAGYGYYSLSSLVIRELSGGDWAAVALLSNISREILTLLLAPILVRLAGPAAPAAAGGATSMDTTLGATVQSSGREWAVPALFSGVVLTIAVPFVVTLILTV